MLGSLESNRMQSSNVASDGDGDGTASAMSGFFELPGSIGADGVPGNGETGRDLPSDRSICCGLLQPDPGPWNLHAPSAADLAGETILGPSGVPSTFSCCCSSMAFSNPDSLRGSEMSS